MARKFGLKMSDIRVDTYRFQPRNIFVNDVRQINTRKKQSQQQLEEMVSYLKADSRHTLEPLKVWLDPLNDMHFIVDGHHRMQAYTEAGWRPNKKIPCVVIEAKDGHEALARVFKDNTRAKMGYTTAERTEAAWKERCRLERDENPPKVKHMKDTFGISIGTASNFNKVINHVKSRKGNQLPDKMGGWKSYSKMLGDDYDSSKSEDDLNHSHATRLANDIAETFERFNVDMQILVAEKLSDRMNDLLGRDNQGNLRWIGMYLKDELDDDF